jgi:hypothetical protein
MALIPGFICFLVSWNLCVCMCIIVSVMAMLDTRKKSRLFECYHTSQRKWILVFKKLSHIEKYFH